MHTFASAVWPGIAIRNRDIDRCAPEGVLRDLAARTATPYERVVSTTLRAFNRYDTPPFQNEQKGVAHLARGLVHAFRNVTAHEPAVDLVISEADALDMMSIASLIHRRLDAAIVTIAFQPPS